MLGNTIEMIRTLGDLITQVLDSGFAILVICAFIGLSYVVGKWILGITKTLVNGK